MRAKTAALGMVAVMVLGGCGDDDDKESSSSATTAPATTTTLSQAQLDKQKAQRINLTAPDLPGYAQDPPDPNSQDSAQFEAAANACVNN
ncbi:MAG TPA: hypothetical protein VMZ73_05170, partial [Acidimicrobiales bacterium]|nr:hypothetical protein [Acidimicrobiales bacterium]